VVLTNIYIAYMADGGSTAFIPRGTNVTQLTLYNWGSTEKPCHWPAFIDLISELPRLSRLEVQFSYVDETTLPSEFHRPSRLCPVTSAYINGMSVPVIELFRSFHLPNLSDLTLEPFSSDGLYPAPPPEGETFSVPALRKVEARSLGSAALEYLIGCFVDYCQLERVQVDNPLLLDHYPLRSPRCFRAAFDVLHNSTEDRDNFTKCLAYFDLSGTQELVMDMWMTGDAGPFTNTRTTSSRYTVKSLPEVKELTIMAGGDITSLDLVLWTMKYLDTPMLEQVHAAGAGIFTIQFCDWRGEKMTRCRKEELFIEVDSNEAFSAVDNLRHTLTITPSNGEIDKVHLLINELTPLHISEPNSDAEVSSNTPLSQPPSKDRYHILLPALRELTIVFDSDDQDLNVDPDGQAGFRVDKLVQEVEKMLNERTQFGMGVAKVEIRDLEGIIYPVRNPSGDVRFPFLLPHLIGD
jgi:hypothetical protein